MKNKFELKIFNAPLYFFKIFLFLIFSKTRVPDSMENIKSQFSHESFCIFYVYKNPDKRSPMLILALAYKKRK